MQEYIILHKDLKWRRVVDWSDPGLRRGTPAARYSVPTSMLESSLAIKIPGVDSAILKQEWDSMPWPLNENALPFYDIEGNAIRVEADAGAGVLMTNTLQQMAALWLLNELSRWEQLAYPSNYETLRQMIVDKWPTPAYSEIDSCPST